MSLLYAKIAIVQLSRLGKDTQRFSSVGSVVTSSLNLHKRQRGENEKNKYKQTI